MDFDALVERMGGEALARRMGQRFLDYYATPLQELREAVTARDGAEVRRLAHSLKGSTSYFEVEPLVSELKRLQDEGEGGDWVSLQTQLETVSGHLEAFAEKLRAWLT